MDAQAIAGVISQIQSSILLILSLLCCFGVVYSLFKAGFHKLKDTPLVFLSGGATLLLWTSLFYRPVFVFVPILLFLLVCAATKESRG
ncbi:MAG TPA: hypothetical protein VN521_08520 [Negativicutes bacterium]|nr:hypothetical protein [Negativicutes bacterium]